MAVNLKKMEGKYEDYKNRRTFGSNFTVEGNKTRFVIMLPPHKNMDEVPYVEKMFHTRDTKDMKGASFSITCQRDNYDDRDFGKCWACKRSFAFRKKRKEKDDKWDLKAKEHSARRKPLSQVIDITPCINKRGEVRKGKEIKKCFGKHGKMDDCEDCFLTEVCEKFIQKWYMPIRCWEQFNDHFIDEGDLTDLNKAVPVRIKRSGKGQYDTKYETKPFTKSAMKLPSGVQKRIMKGLIDLTAEDPKPSAKTDEDLKKIYKDFFSFADVSVGDDDDDDDDDDDKKDKKDKKEKTEKKSTNKKMNKKKTDKKKTDKKKTDKKKTDKKKDKEKKSKRKDDKLQLRSKMKNKARKGKLNRDDDDDIPY